MAKASEKIRMVFTKNWFEQFMGVLCEQQDNLKDLIEDYHDDKELRESFTDGIKENQKLINKINQLEKENKQLKIDYNVQKEEAEYWYYYNVDDAC